MKSRKHYRMVEALESRVFLSVTRFDFLGGESGSVIEDGGGNMFDGGNSLFADDSYPIEYTGGAVRSGADSATFGAHSSYFTQKFPGLFVLSADDIVISKFEIGGSAGDAGNGREDSAVLPLGEGYTGFVFRHYGSTSPSINQLVIVHNSDGAVTQTTSDGTSSWYHQTLSNLGDESELHYLLFSAADGGYISNERMTVIGNSWVSLLDDGATGYERYSAAMNFGVAPIKPGNIGGIVWNDANRNRVIDDTEDRFSGWTVFADLDRDGVFDSAEPSGVTESSGRYFIAGLMPRVNYSIIAIPQGNWTATIPARLAAIVNGEMRSDVHIGYATPLPGTISGYVFPDADRNDEADGTGSPSGMRVYADLNHDGQWDATEPSSVVNMDGSYTLTKVPAGHVRISIVKTAGVEPAKDFVEVTLGSGGTLYYISVGLVDHRTASITGVTWNDANRNERQDAGELPTAGRTVYVDRNEDNRLTPGEPSTVTDAAGSYRLDGIGLYTVFNVLQVVPEGWLCRGGLILLQPGDVTPIDVPSYEVPPTQMRGMTFEDRDLDGELDRNESGIAGRTVYIDSNSNNAFDEGDTFAVTDADGRYTLTLKDITADGGEYLVQQVVPTGWMSSAFDNVAIFLSQGETVDGINLGSGVSVNWSIGGTVFGDTNYNGLLDDSEPSYTDVTVFLDHNSDGIRQQDERAAAVDESGHYEFVGLYPYFYRVSVAGLASDEISVPHNANYLDGFPEGVDLPVRKIHPYSIAGTVYEDQNVNEWQDVTERGIADLTVFIDLDGDHSPDADEPSTITDSTGFYQFTALNDQSYRVEVVPFTFYREQPWEDLNGLMQDGPDFVNFAMRSTAFATMRGTLWWDKNHNNLVDPGEPLNANRTVFVDVDGDNALDSDEPHGTTDANGQYRFQADVSLFISSNTTLNQLIPAGWTGPLYDYPGYVQPGDEVVISLPSEPVGRGSITGTIWHDVDDSHSQDAGEPPLPGRTVFLDLDSDFQLSPDEPSVITDAAGHYSFGNLEAGYYRIELVDLPGWSDLGTAAYVGNAAQVVADILVTGWIASVTGFISFNGGGQSGLRVYVDENGNSKRDSGEPSTLTDQFGYFSLDVRDQPQLFIFAVEGVSSDQLPGNFVQVDRADASEIILQAQASSGSIKGRLFNDTNDSGKIDLGETPLAGRTVFADADNDAVLDAGEISAVTDADGFYRLDGLDYSRSYTVRQVLPSGWVGTGHPLSAIPNPFNPPTANLGSLDTGSHPIGGTVWIDVNFNGVIDAGEEPLPGTTIYLDTNNNGRFDAGDASRVTDSAGQYVFQGISVRATVRQVVPTGYWQTLPVAALTGRLARLLKLLDTEYVTITSEIV